MVINQHNPTMKNFLILFISNYIVTLNSLLSSNSITISVPTVFLSFGGVDGFITNNLLISGSTGTVRFTSNLNYIINSSLVITGLSGTSKVSLSNITGSRANFTLGFSATQNVKYCNATSLDSSAGQTIYTTGSGILTNTINWGKQEGNFLLMF